MVYLHNFVRQAKGIQKMEHEIFLVVKGSFQLLEFYSVLETVRHRDRSQHGCALHHGAPGPLCPSPSPPHPCAWHLWEPDAP